MKLKLSSVLVLLGLALCLPLASQAQVAHASNLAWNASTTSGVGYNMYRSLAAAGPYVKLNTSPIVGLAYSDTTVIAGTTYFWQVTAVCTPDTATCVGESARSNTFSATIPSDPIPPNAPSNLHTTSVQ